MMHSPLVTEPLFHIGAVPVSTPVAITWALMTLIAVASITLRRQLSLTPGKLQTAAELFVSTLDSQLQDTMQVEPARCRALLGTLFLFILACNWSGLIPGVEPPTAHLETDAALAGVVFVSTVLYGIRERGLARYLASFAQPTWIMIPLNLVEQITRTFSLIVRLFGNVMSGVFVIGIVLSLAGLLVPIPLMALDLLTGTVQAYIFTVLAAVFIGAALGGEGAPASHPRQGAS
ncbi:F0F1 ATP synthase subunit A [Burkholderia sp. IDO3]|uniref:F0F1 ATP synthase subunit A n=1 Tax=Burkholderia sp. IDO3 TaxID=1705310 RepID=UPI000BBA4FB7|nr:F0F1 ATP synthase subunit A [Burkholderia sp. IDO3]AXK67403.1 F0F1 ATP synthase subunit A [Burkholderia sp. IDO3]PCD60035.1 ATP synthase F0 subunit A [Burkholderia sp. IDO3]